MIIVTTDYDHDGNATIMLTDTTFSGGHACIDVQKNVVNYLVRFNNGTTLIDTIENCYHVNEALKQAAYEIADTLALDASNHDNNCNYNTVYARLRDTLDSELNLC